MADDGVIKFNCEWVDKPLSIQIPDELKYWRDKMHQLKLIGEYADVNIGYGNISLKTGNGFLISGTQTGNVYPIKNSNFSLVTTYDMKLNQVLCEGSVKASAESLTHAAIYEADESIKAVIHIHNKALWDSLIDKVSTSSRDVAYGTASMATEIKRLFNETSAAKEKIIVMGGHEEGIISFGENLEEAGNVILSL